MSFLKRFISKSDTSKTSTPPSEGCQESNVKSKDSTHAEGVMTPDSHGELSLFSGMTFSSTASTSHSSTPGDILDNKTTTVDEHQDSTVQGIQELQELKEVFENLDFKETKGDAAEAKESVFSSENEKEPKDIVEKELLQETQATLSSSSGQQSKKKKRTQAKRPGYARENQNISHPKSKTTGKRSATSNPSTAIQKTDDTAAVSEHTHETEKTVEVLSELPLQPKHVPLKMQMDVNVDNFVYKDEENLGAEDKHEIFSKQDTQNLYSIDTPSSSEENLVDIGKEQEYDFGRKSPGNDEEEAEMKESVEKETEAFQGVGTGKDIEPLGESEDPIMAKEDGIGSNENIHDALVKLSEEKEQTSPVDEESKSNEESPKERDGTYNLQLDAEEKSSLVEQNLQFRISGLRDEETILQELENELLENYSNSGSAYLGKQRELENLTQEEANALANDNYDLAEELSAKIEELKASLEKAKYQLPAVDTKVQQALQLRSELSLKRLSIIRDAQVTLEELREEQASSLDAFNEENNTKISKEKQTLNAERQRLDRARAHLQLDTEHLEKEENVLEDEIHQKTEEFVHRKESLAEEREKIRDEIAEVERRLEQLRINESQCTKNIEAEDLKIKEIVEEFLPLKEPLNKQRQELEDQDHVLNSDQESLNLAQESFNKLVESWSTKKERLTELLNSLQSTISSNKSSIDVLEKQRGEIEEFLCLKHLSFTQDSTLNKLKTSATQTNQQIKSLTSKINLSERNIASLRKKVTEIEDQISDRNEAKDIAKKERNFKEAKRLKEDIETLKAEGIESQKKLEHCLEELNEDTVLLQNKEKEFEKINEELKEIEHESDLKLVNSAAKVIKGLQGQISRYEGSEFLHTLLTAEISTCQNLINELCSKHSISAPIIEHEEPQPRDVTIQSEELENINLEVDENPCIEQCTAVDEEPKEVQEKEETEDLLSQLDELEGKLEAVVDMEDFDEADRIQQEIIQLKMKLEHRS